MELTISNFLFGVSLFIILWKVIPLVRIFIKLQKRSLYSGQIDIQERWSKSKIPKNIDVIVIGSGMSGLCSAAYFSKIGKKVLVLEQHSIAGGCVHSFKEQGYEFDSGFHYIGNKNDYMQIWKMAMSTPVDFRVFQDFDQIKFNNENPYLFQAPKRKFIQNLKNEFPDMVSEINTFFKLSKKSLICAGLRAAILIMTNIQLIRSPLLSILSFFFSDVWNKTTKQIFDKTGISKSSKLAGLLNGQIGDIGVCTSNDVWFSDQMGLLDHFLNGSIYPRGGSMEIVKSIMGTILANGGQVLCKARVSKIITEKGKVKGVIVNEDSPIDAPLVISSVGFIHTNELIPSQFQIPIKYQDGIGHFYLFVGVKGNASELKIPPGNMYHYPDIKDYNIDEQRLQYYNLTSQEVKKHTSFPTFTCFPSVKAEEEQKTDKFSCIVLAEAKTEWVKQFEISDVKRNSEYAEFKKSIQDNMLALLLNNYPQLKGHIDYVDLGTPLTNKTYYNRYSSYGLQYGMKRSQDHYSILDSTTKVKGLFLTGQDIFIPGIAPSVIAGFLTFLKSSGAI